MTSCIPIRVLLIYDGILQYSFGFGLYTGTSRVQKHQKTACCWILKSLAGNCNCGCLPVVEITDYVHSRDDSFNVCLEGSFWMRFLSWQNSITKLDRCFKLHTMHFTCSCWTQLLHSFMAWKAGHSVQTYFLSFSFLSPEIKKIRLASIQARPHFLKEEKGWMNWHKSCVLLFRTVQFNHFVAWQFWKWQVSCKFFMECAHFTHF